jgi:cell division ATPase FtsA
MDFIFSNKKNERIVAVFDIGSGSVGGAIVRIPTSGKGVPLILKSVRTDIKSSKEKIINFDVLMKEMLVTLGATANSLYNYKAGAPSEIYCTMASPWYLSETRVIKVKKEKPFIFSKRLASELIQKEIINLKEVYKDKYNNVESQPEVIEQHTMSVSLNGYHVNDPIGKKCNFFEINMIISLFPKLYLNKIRETLSRTFHHTDVMFSTFTVSTYLAIRDKYIKSDSYLILDISGEMTDVGIVTEGVLKSILSFPYGKKTFLRNMCSEMKIEPRDAKELFKLYTENNLSLEIKNKIDPVFDFLKNSWGEFFKKCINKLPKTLILPNIIFLTSDNDISKLFVNLLKNEEYSQLFVSGNNSIITLEGPQFLDTCNIKDGKCDQFLMIEVISIMRKMHK